MSIAMRKSALLLASVALIGCVSKTTTNNGFAPDEKRAPVIGTWQGRETEGGNQAATRPAGFQFASVSFVYDGTFTAQMRYNGHLMADSGTWKLDGSTLTVMGSHGAHGSAAPQARTYTVERHGNELSITDPQTKVTVVLDQLREGAKTRGA